MGWQFPDELDIDCPTCGQTSSVPQVSIRGTYQGYCQNPDCEEWIDYDYDEALALEEAERQIDAKRDERYT